MTTAVAAATSKAPRAPNLLNEIHPLPCRPRTYDADLHRSFGSNGRRHYWPSDQSAPPVWLASGGGAGKLEKSPTQPLALPAPRTPTQPRNHPVINTRNDQRIDRTRGLGSVASAAIAFTIPDELGSCPPRWRSGIRSEEGPETCALLFSAADRAARQSLPPGGPPCFLQMKPGARLAVVRRRSVRAHLTRSDTSCASPRRTREGRQGLRGRAAIPTRVCRHALRERQRVTDAGHALPPALIPLPHLHERNCHLAAIVRRATFSIHATSRAVNSDLSSRHLFGYLRANAALRRRSQRRRLHHPD